jgi:L-arabinokinase
MDLTAFLDTLRAARVLDADAPLVVARAPGRLDVMGGIADYSGALVLQRPIAEATFVAVQRTGHNRLEITSLGREPFVLPLDALTRSGEPIGYEQARARFAGAGTDGWRAYVVGVFLVLMRERGVRFPDGAVVAIASAVPEGKGVSSSAALETATMQAVASAYHIALTPRELALLCQKAENLVAGAPCGVMDQMACVFGEEDCLLALLCQPAELQPSVRIPDDIAFWGLDSGERHAVGGSDYSAVRTGAFMGHRILAEHAGLRSPYLAGISPSQFERECLRHLPETMSGAEFLSRYSGTADTVTTVDPARRYAIRQPTAHPIHEHHRVGTFRQLLLAPPGEERRVLLGELMYQSHESYAACGLGSRGTNAIVDLVRAEGPALGLYGARITGGGSGGTVAILGRSDAASAVAHVAGRYAAMTGHPPYLFAGSSPGVAAWGRKMGSGVI